MEKVLKKNTLLPFVGLSVIFLILFINSSTKTDSIKVEAEDYHSLVILGTEDMTIPSSFDLEYIVITETPIPTPTFTPSPTPTNTPTPRPLPPTSSDLENWFTKYSSEYSVNREILKKIAACESGFNSSSNSGVYGGMYQFSVGAWISARSRMNTDTNPDLRFHAEESIKTAAFKISVDSTRAWPNCAK